MTLPRLSIIVVVYKMKRQAMNTLYSLSPRYQHGCSEHDYEVLVMENHSTDNLDAQAIDQLGGNFRSFLRNDNRPTPVYAVNEGIEHSQGSHICLMIDGARMVTPGLIRQTLDLIRALPAALVCAPGYHIGEQDQKHHLDSGHDEAREINLLDNINWPENGYDLFRIACFSGANSHGFFHPLMESNCMTCSRESLLHIGGAHLGFQTPGGGSVNLDIYRNLAILPDSQLFILAGEGSFHQFHGGVTTTQDDELEAILASHREEMKRIRGDYYSAALREPIIYGQIPRYAHPFLVESSIRAVKRFRRFANQGQAPWPDEPKPPANIIDTLGPKQ